MEKFSVLKIACIIFVVCAATAVGSPALSLTTLHRFDYTDGSEPQGALVHATDGNFYGTTAFGGAYGYGTVFKITPDGTLTTVHSFDYTDGYEPLAGLVQATDGNFYGTTAAGGPYNGGTVFRITPDGTLTTVHSFDVTDGAEPEAPLVQATDGNFYGTTAAGGPNLCNSYEECGTVFKITPDGALTTLHSFDETDGFLPLAGLVQATDGNFYGTTYFGGAFNYGTVFKITPDGTLTTVHSFDYTDGSQLLAGLVQATDGNFYGTTFGGGAYTYGTVFKITPDGTLTTLHSFDVTDGASPFAEGLVQATDGNFYGTTRQGGTTEGYGTVFKLIVQTPQQATQAIINAVNALLSQGVLNGGQDNSLVVKLEHAINDMNAGNDAAASRMILNAFIGEVNDLLTSGVLSPSQAALLVSYAHSVIAQLS